MSRQLTTAFVSSSLVLWVMTFCVPAAATVIHSTVYKDFKSPKNVIILDRANKTDVEFYNWNKVSLLALTDVKIADSGIVKKAHVYHVNVILVADVVKEFKQCDITDKKCRSSWISGEHIPIFAYVRFASKDLEKSMEN